MLDTNNVNQQPASSARIPRPTPSPEKEQGLDSVLENLAPSVERARSLSGKIEVLVTLDGRTPLHLGLASLSPWQRAFYETARRRARPPDLRDPDTLEFALGVRANGRIVLAAPEAVRDGDVVFTRVALSAAEALAVDVAYLQACAAEAPRVAEMERAIASWDDALAQQKARRLAEGLDHVDPILVHFEHESLSNTPHDNNLLKSRGGTDSEQYLLTRLPALPLADWSDAARTFVYCLDLLLDAGFRGEEFNSQYLSPARLNAFFDRVLQSYAAAVPGVEPPATMAPLADKAAAIKRGRSTLSQHHRFYRWVHGITLYKEQRFFAKSDLTAIVPATLPAPVRQHLQAFVDPARHETCYALFRDFVERTAGAADVPRFLNLHPIDALIVLLVDAVTDELASDLGMSRCLRSLAELARVHDSDKAEEANAWTQAAYFCAVVPQRFLRARGIASTRGLRNVLKAISARMRFNAWHYMPGHFARERCAPDRHFYLPPAMSDTAEWSDQRHRGHVAAEVRYSIRAPAPLVYKGKVYPGMLDLRLMRRDGTPYTLTDLKRANEYVAVLEQLYQAVLDVSAERGPFTIEGFTNEWFESVPWEALP